MQRDMTALLDINKAAKLAIAFTQGYNKQAFIHDAKTQSAVLHQLSIVGEATKSLSESFRRAHPDIPWKSISGMRDHLVHAYDAVDVEEVWNVVTHDLPDLLKQLEPLLPIG